MALIISIVIVAVLFATAQYLVELWQYWQHSISIKVFNEQNI